MELVFAHPNELRAHWPAISAALDSVIDSTSPDWIKEDVYHRIKTDSARANLIYDGGRYQAMFILTNEREEYSGKPSMHIWIAHCIGGAPAYDFGLDAIKQIARSLGASRLTLESPRPGWGKRFPLVSATYEVPLA